MPSRSCLFFHPSWTHLGINTGDWRAKNAIWAACIGMRYEIILCFYCPVLVCLGWVQDDPAGHVCFHSR